MTVDIEIRREKILRILVNNYITTGVPVSSRTICSQHSISLCPASVRNVMADLEERGLITHLHTSAGRVPTDKGYRYYVDKLVGEMGLTRQEQLDISKELFSKQLILEDIIRKTSRILSDFTHYASIVTNPAVRKSYFKHIQFVHLADKKVFVTLIANTGISKSAVVTLDFKIDAEGLKRIENLMNTHLENVPLSQIKTKLRRMMIQEKNSLFYVLKQALEFLDLIALIEDKTNLYFEGLSNMLSFPEFEDLKIMRSFMRDLDKKGVLMELIQELLEEETDMGKVKIFIGSENPQSTMNPCSVILGCYKIDNHTIGGLGVIGPKRMQYGKTIATVKYVADILGEILTGLTS
ncbi:MAG: heat-inducible transcriptional repressor HrcA [Candidatus Omnitrophica bacterium]|nr:heat-inducible transcriptional repressor HrcA [Candidatus Omnitrophota bacterium]